MSCNTNVGSMISLTVTVAVVDCVFPEASVAVSITVFRPVLEQSKDDGEIDNAGAPQLSEEPLLTSSAVIVMFPELSRLTEMSFPIAKGSITSLMMTLTETVVELVEGSMKRSHTYLLLS